MKRFGRIKLYISAALVFALLLGVWHSALAATIITNDTYSIGRQGIFIPGGFSTDFVRLTRVNQSEFDRGPIDFTRPLLRLQYFNNEGQSIGIPFALTYVFYNLHGFELRAWQEGELDLYYLDTTDNTWKPCNAFQTKMQNGDARIACVATQATYFGLGEAR